MPFRIPNRERLVAVSKPVNFLRDKAALRPAQCMASFGESAPELITVTTTSRDHDDNAGSRATAPGNLPAVASSCGVAT